MERQCEHCLASLERKGESDIFLCENCSRYFLLAKNKLVFLGIKAERKDKFTCPEMTDEEVNNCVW